MSVAVVDLVWNGRRS